VHDKRAAYGPLFLIFYKKILIKCKELAFCPIFKIEFLLTWIRMGLFRALLCIIFPPLAVVDKGCGSFLIVFILTLIGWIPGVIASLIICSKKG
jgi:uncharacterized membrane protein YqaE (UPF0057 family)